MVGWAAATLLLRHCQCGRERALHGRCGGAQASPAAVAHSSATLPRPSPARPRAAQEVVEFLGRNDGIVVMAPPSDSGEARKAVATLLSAVKPKQKVVVAESYGGRDEPLDTLTAGLLAAGVEPLMDLRVREDPTEAVYQVGRGGGGVLAQYMWPLPGARGRQLCRQPCVLAAVPPRVLTPAPCPLNHHHRPAPAPACCSCLRRLGRTWRRR